MPPKAKRRKVSKPETPPTVPTRSPSPASVAGSEGHVSEGSKGSHTSAIGGINMEGVLSMTTQAFKENIWGKEVFVARCSDETVERLSEGFGDGDKEFILPQCRNDNNAVYTPEQMRDFETEHEERRKTLTFPLCFTEGAHLLRSAFLDEFRDFGNDVEVGVYFSRTGGDVAELHSDNNHNITIQMKGEKEWTICTGNPNTTCSRPFSTPHHAQRPKNSYEVQTLSQAQIKRKETYRLVPGSVIYLPPGAWHEVASVGGEDSFSIDLRIGNVIKSKLLCEALYAGLLQEFNINGGFAQSLEPADFTGGSVQLSNQIAYVLKNLKNVVHKIKLPRTVACSRELSNGLERGVYLSDIVIPKMGPVPVRSLHLNALVCGSVKYQDGKWVVLRLISESSLSSMEYLRLSIYAGMQAERVARLVVDGTYISAKSLENNEERALFNALVFLNILT